MAIILYVKFIVPPSEKKTWVHHNVIIMYVDNMN